LIPGHSPYVVTEACYLVGKYVGAVAEINLVEALVAGDLGQIDITAADLNRDEPRIPRPAG
jgi:uncharacterized protein